MAALNTQYVQLSDKVVKRYTKTVPHMVAGVRANPFDTTVTVPFLLQTPEEYFDFETKEVTGTHYESDVLELYSDVEVTLFQRLNAPLFKAGLLKEYTERAPEADTSNILTDDEVRSIASTQTPNQLKSRLATITSVPTLNRILKEAKLLDRTIKVIDVITARITEVSA